MPAAKSRSGGVVCRTEIAPADRYDAPSTCRDISTSGRQETYGGHCRRLAERRKCCKTEQEPASPLSQANVASRVPCARGNVGGTRAAHISTKSAADGRRRRPCRSVTDVSSDSATDSHWRTVRSAVYTARARVPGDRSMLQEGQIRGPAPGYHKAHCRRHRWVVRDRWCIEEIGCSGSPGNRWYVH